ncbi:hypothetical protein [Rossellomorea vietnamensis]|uniref:hypothetical protein n=1 Tax=Rossellomorea vietnamensis TaxID=218284 RepID=UPI003D2BB3AD
MLVENLRINPEMAKKSYVTDFARISNEKGKRDTKKCKELLLMEIQILNPKLVILVGAEPRDAFINEIQRYPDKFMSVPFSLIGVPKKQKKKGH